MQETISQHRRDFHQCETSVWPHLLSSLAHTSSLTCMGFCSWSIATRHRRKNQNSPLYPNKSVQHNLLRWSIMRRCMHRLHDHHNCFIVCQYVNAVTLSIFGLHISIGDARQSQFRHRLSCLFAPITHFSEHEIQWPHLAGLGRPFDQANWIWKRVKRMPFVLYGLLGLLSSRISIFFLTQFSHRSIMYKYWQIRYNQ